MTGWDGMTPPHLLAVRADLVADAKEREAERMERLLQEQSRPSRRGEANRKARRAAIAAARGRKA